MLELQEQCRWRALMTTAEFEKRQGNGKRFLNVKWIKL